jgi:AraC-like DNA-binding protein
MNTFGAQSTHAFYAATVLPLIEELLARGIAQGAIEAQLHKKLFDLRTPFMRLPLVVSRGLWAFAVEQSGDPLIGLAAGQRFVSTTHNGLTYLFDVAVSLERACDYFARFFSRFSGHFKVQIVRENGAVQLRLVECGALRAAAPVADFIVVSLCAMLRRKLLLSGIKLDPIVGVALTTAGSDEHQRAFNAPVLGQQPNAAIHLDAQLFGTLLTPRQSALEDTLVEVLEQTLRNSESTLLEQVSDYLIDNLATADWKQFCATQHLLERTAARRLKALGWGFAELLDDYRRYRAEDLLRLGELELVEVSDRLGYSDVQGFNRACLRWFGCAPGGYRSVWGRR